MASLVSLKVGGQLDISVDSNIVIPDDFWDFTRSYADVEGESVEMAVQMVFLAFMILLIGTFFHFFRIMYLHFLYYLVMNQELVDNFEKYKKI